MFSLFKSKTDLIEENVSLKKDIDRLYSTQTILKSIAKLTSFEDIAIEILTQIEKKLGYTASSFSVVSWEDKTIQLKYFSNSPLSKFGQKLILNDNATRVLHLNDNILTFTKLAALENKMYLDNDISKFISPPLSVEKAKLIQNVCFIKGMIAVPLSVGGEVIAVLNLTTKAPVEKISVNEIKTLELFMTEVGLIVDSVNKYNTLQVKKDQLQSINTFTNRIISTLDTSQILQNAMDSMQEVFKCSGAVYYKIDYDLHRIKAEAVTHTEFVPKFINILERGITDYYFDYDDPELQDTANVRAFKEDKIIIETDLNNVGRKIIPKKALDLIQKVAGMKAILSAPVHIKGKIIGILSIAISHKTKDEITSDDLQTLSFLAGQMGIAFENSNLFNETQKTLDELSELYRQEKDMLGIMGHELRTPITFAKGFVERLNSKVESEPMAPLSLYKSNILNAWEGLKREAVLIETLLTSSKIDNGKLNLNFSKVDLDRCIKMTYREFITEAEDKNLLLAYHEVERVPHIYCDEIRTQEVITNLVSNAIKYTKEGRIDVSVDYDKEFVYLSVKDTGEGISKKDLSNIGKKFFRINNYLDETGRVLRPGGTGLGMYVVKSIVKASGGELIIKSEVNKGSTFTAKFPIYKDEYDRHNNPERQKLDQELDLFVRMGLKKPQ